MTIAEVFARIKVTENLQRKIMEELARQESPTKKKNLSELLLGYKKNKGLTVEALRNELKVGVETIYNLLDPKKASKCSLATLKKVASLLDKSIEEVIESQEQLKRNKSIPTEKEIESGARKLSICTGCYKVEKREDDNGNYKAYKILSPTFYNDSDYIHCIECGANLDSYCKNPKCKKPIISLEHKHCPYCGNKYPGRGGAWCKKCEYNIDYKQLISRTKKCPNCNAYLPYNLEFSKHSNIKDTVIWTMYLNDVFETNKEEFEMMFPLYEINSEVKTSKIMSEDLKTFLNKCVDNLNSRWSWGVHDGGSLIDKDFLKKDTFLPPGYDFFDGASRKPSIFIIEVADDFGLFGASPYKKKLSLPELSDKKIYGELDFFEFCDGLYKSGKYTKEYLESRVYDQ